MKIVVFSPHRDDAAFSLALAVGYWIDAGHKVHVINCFSRSEEAPFSDVDFVHPSDRMSFVTALRGREDEAWRKQYGPALTIEDLNMKDAPRRLHCSSEEVYGRAVDPADRELQKIQRAAAQAMPGALVIPAAIGGHIDHMIVCEALVSRAGVQVACAFYEDLPYAAALPAERIEESMIELQRACGAELNPVFAGKLGDSAAAVSRKRRAALCYDSHVNDVQVEQIADFCLRYDGRERLWTNPAWLESEIASAH